MTTTDDKVLTGAGEREHRARQVLACLPGLDETLAAEIIRVRTEKRFETVADLLNVTGITKDVFKKVCNSVDVRSDVFGVRSFGVLRSSIPGEAPYCCVCAVIDRTGDAIKIKSWREPN